MIQQRIHNSAVPALLTAGCAIVLCVTVCCVNICEICHSILCSRDGVCALFLELLKTNQAGDDKIEQYGLVDPFPAH